MRSPRLMAGLVAAFSLALTGFSPVDDNPEDDLPGAPSTTPEQQKREKAIMSLGASATVMWSTPRSGEPLMFLSLDGARATDAVFARITETTAIAVLSLRDTAISDDGLAHLKDFPALRSLTISNYGGSKAVTDAGLAQVGRLTGLRSLDLDIKGMTDAGVAHLKGLRSLRSLGLWGPSLTDGALANVEGMKDLEFLGVAFCPIGDAGIAHLAGLKRLKELNLYATEVTDVGLRTLEGLPNLQIINLSVTKVTNQGVAALQKALPKLQVARFKL